MLASLLMFAASCGRPAEVYWKDGNFKVYATDDDFNATKLGYDHRPGLLGLVESEVVAAGSNEQYVFVERRTSAGIKEFYLTRNEKSAHTHSGNVEGPYTETEFRDIRRARVLPEFAWRKRTQ